ncbi:hypothetical protein KJ359_006973 [Pestalotiopsis sp. 9143b]|nr:hypothetical protein KJ359_006973 [Pestalotiopsis sp. 9143b]
MLMKAYITAVALAASVLAAPVPESCTSTSATARGLGIICTGAAASKRAPEPVPEPEPESCTSTSATARGLGIICTGAAASKREPVPEPAPEPAPESCSEVSRSPQLSLI